MDRSRRTERASCVRNALALASLLVAAGSAAAAASDPAQELAFARRGEPVATRDLAWLREAAPPAAVRVHEPYESREVAFEALPLEQVLDAVYTRSWRSQEELLFTCRDGYQPTVPVARVLAHRPWLAFARADREAFTIDKLESGRVQEIELEPFYLVWENLDDPVVRQEADYGWPYQLVGIDLIETRDRFPRMMPPEGASEQVLSGFAAFRIHCSRCHPLNGEGGTLGPELNGEVPLVEVRDGEFLRGWIEDPAKIRPGSRMPPLNPALPDRARTVDAILAYLRAMAAAKVGSAGVGSFEAFYASELHHPILLWLAGGLALLSCAVRRRLDSAVKGYCTILTALSLADAWLTSTRVYGIGELPEDVASVVQVFFVLAGDYRYLLLLLAATREGGIQSTPRSLLVAAGLTAIVPLASHFAVSAMPAAQAPPRVLFLVYEVMFFALAAGLAHLHPNARRVPWLRPVSACVLLYYALWATADAILLTSGDEVGYGLRVVPNVLYYGGLIAVIGWAASRAARPAD